MSTPEQAVQPPVSTIRDVGQHEGQMVTIRGWLYNLRESGKLLFPIIRDGSGLIQGVVFKKAVAPELFEAIKDLTQESSIVVTGQVRADRRAPGGYELDVKNAQVVQRVPDDEPYPITPKEHGIEFLMEHRHLWVRSPRQAAILRIRHEIMKAIHDFFDERGFIRTDPPILTPAACEGTSTLFPADYFEEQAYLTQSGQLYIEATAMALGKVYSFGPTFRAEKSKTRRHLTEFWMVEPEVAFADLDDIMALAEEFVSFIVARVLERRASGARSPRARHREARDDQGALPAHQLRRGGQDAARGARQGELEAIRVGRRLRRARRDPLSSQFDRPVMVHRYPAEVKAFYMKPDPQRPTLALGVDVLAPEGYGEIIGGGSASATSNCCCSASRSTICRRRPSSGISTCASYGTVPHAGFGMGIERVVAWICGLEHVRETIPFPRTLNRIYP